MIACIQLGQTKNIKTGCICAGLLEHILATSCRLDRLTPRLLLGGSVPTILYRRRCHGLRGELSDPARTEDTDCNRDVLARLDTMMGGTLRHQARRWERNSNIQPSRL